MADETENARGCSTKKPIGPQQVSIEERISNLQRQVKELRDIVEKLMQHEHGTQGSMGHATMW